jgi:hypothetical protein
MSKARENTCKMLDMVDQGIIDKDTLIHNLLNWMSESEVTEFMESTELLEDEE